jgi:DnaJ-class molecular chaperone
MSGEIVEKIVKCPPCEGFGWTKEPGDDDKTLTFCELCKSEGTLKVTSDMKVCGLCKGKGKVIVMQKTIWGMTRNVVKCSRCKGMCMTKNETK